MRRLWLALGLLLVPSVAEAQTDSVWAFAVIPVGVDSIVARSQRDTTVLTIRNGARMVLWGTPESRTFRLRDSLRVWCTGSCQWEWDSVVPVDSTSEGSPLEITTWGLDAVKAPVAWQMGFTGRGVIVTSLDSGIDPNQTYHVAGGYGVAGTGWNDDIAECRGHGTHVAGTMADTTGYGVARGARLYGVKVFSLQNGQCLASTSYQVAGLNWAVANGSRCVNISIGGSVSSTAYQNAITAAWNAGVVVSAANGNSGTTPALFPGRALNALGVASVGPSLTRSGFANYGPSTDLSAPGEGVVSTMPGGGYASKTGTSMAAPHVCGVAALVMEAKPSASAMEVMTILQQSAEPLGAVPNEYTGYGLVRADRAVAMALGGVWIVGDTLQTVVGEQEKCFPVVNTRPYTVSVTAGVPWRMVGESLCLTLATATPRSIQVVLQ